MIWIDSSFAVEFLLGTSRAANVAVAGDHFVTLSGQYSEICVFFLRRDSEFEPSMLEPIELMAPDEAELLSAGKLYVAARSAGSKASLADATLAAVALLRGGDVLTFDEDFRYLGLRRTAAGRWSRA